MAKRRSKSKPLDVQVTELASVIEASHSCVACGKPITADATTCPHCGTPVGEAAELHEKAEESLMDLEKHLAATGETPAAQDPNPEPMRVGLESAAEVVALVEISDPAPPPPSAPPAVVAEILPEPVAPVEPEVQEGEELEGFIEEIEAEVGPAEPGPRAAPQEAPAARTPAVRAVPRVVPAPRGSRWVAPIAAGLVLYSLALFLLTLLGRFVVASFMIIGTVLVVAGLRARPGSSAGSARGRGSRSEEYVCPLCGTEIKAHAAQCPTCGAVFEE